MKFSTYQLIAATALGLTLGGTAQADLFDGDLDLDGGDGVKWEDPLNWAGDIVPLNNTTAINIDTDFDVVFDGDTWAALTTAGNLQNSTEHRIARLLMGDRTTGAANGTHSLTLDQGAGNTVRATNGTSAVIGGRTNKHSTLNIESGITNLEANAIRVGGQVDGSGTVNVNGGSLILGRGGLQLGITDGIGTLNINGGEFTTRNMATVGSNGTFHVAGSAPSVVGIGSNNNVDGAWDQAAGGILRTGLDAGGFTSILIDETDGDAGVGNNGNATFAAGSILDPYDLGGAPTNVWTTVMSWEGVLSNSGLGLSTTATDDGWMMQIVGNELQVMLAGSAGLVGDYSGDGFVSQADLDLVLLNWGNNTAPVGFDEANLEGGGPFDGLMSQNELDGVLLNWGDGTPPSVAAVPEPTSLALIGLGGLALAGRRRRQA